MSRVAVQLRVKLADTWEVGDKVQVYTDYGTGTVDTDNPLLPEPIEMFPGDEPERGLGEGALGEGSLGGVGPPLHYPGGLGETPLGEVPLGDDEPYITVTAYVPDAFGTWKFAAGAVDEAGNVQGDALEEIEAFVSGEDPPALTVFAFAGYDDDTDKATFSFAMGGD